MGKETTIEVGRSPELPAGGDTWGVHLAEEVAEHVVAALPPLAGVQSERELQVRQQTPIFSKQTKNALQHEPLGLQSRESTALFTPFAQSLEQFSHAAGLGLCNLDLVETEVHRLFALAEESKRRRLAGQIRHPQLHQRLINKLVEVVDPQLIEVAEHRIDRLGRQVDPVALQLGEVGPEGLAPALHLDQHRGARCFDQGVRLAHAAGQAALGDLALEGGARLHRIGPAPGLQQPIHVGLRLAGFIAPDRGHPVGESLQGLGCAQRAGCQCC